MPGTGLSHTEMLTSNKKTKTAKSSAETRKPQLSYQASDERPVGVTLGAGILLMPYFFVWFLLRKGYSNKSRLLGFIWLALVVSILYP
mgnify:CR=1 FL=1